MEEEYTKVNQDWIDNYIDGFKDLKDITFYDENKNPENFDYHTDKYKTWNVERSINNAGPEKYPGKPLYIKNKDSDKLAHYILEQKNKTNKRFDNYLAEQAIRDANEKKREEENIRKNKEQIKKTKAIILNTIFDSQLLSEGDKESLVNNVTDNDVENRFTLNQDYNQNEIFERVVRLLHNSIKNMTNIFSSIQYVSLPEIDNENIELKRIVTKNDKGFITTYTIKIKTPHIIFYYDFKTQQFTLYKMIIGKEYTIENEKDSFIIHTEPLIYGSKPIQNNESKYLFYIYKVEANTVLDSEENALRPFNQAPNVAPIEEPRQLGCLGKACKTFKNAFKRDATINPAGGKRTRKQKKTRKHKKVHRKNIHKKK
jgi:hypothetical protein